MSNNQNEERNFMSAAIALALQLLPAAENLWSFITATRAAAMQSGEWTADAEEAYQKAVLAGASAPEQQPDAAG